MFRELHAPEEEAVLLSLLEATELEWTDVLPGETSAAAVNEEGTARFAVERPASFRWFSYRPRG